MWERVKGELGENEGTVSEGGGIFGGKKSTPARQQPKQWNHAGEKGCVSGDQERTQSKRTGKKQRRRLRVRWSWGGANPKKNGPEKGGKKVKPWGHRLDPNLFLGGN